MGIEQIVTRLTNAGLRPSVVQQGENFLVRFSGKNGKQFSKLYNGAGTLLGSKTLGNGVQTERRFLYDVIVDGKPFADKVIQTKKVSSKDGLFEQFIAVRNKPLGGKDIGIGTRINGANPTTQQFTINPKTQIQPYQKAFSGTGSSSGRTIFTTKEGVKIEMPSSSSRQKQFTDGEYINFTEVGTRTVPLNPSLMPTPSRLFPQPQVAAFTPYQPGLSSGVIGMLGLGAVATLASGSLESGPPPLSEDDSQATGLPQGIAPEQYEQYLIQQQQAQMNPDYGQAQYQGYSVYPQSQGYSPQYNPYMQYSPTQQMYQQQYFQQVS